MSDKIKSLKEILNQLVEEELNETSTSSDAGFYNIPAAFRGNSAEGKAKAKKIASQAGYEPVKGAEEKADDMGDPEERVVQYGEGKKKKPVVEDVSSQEYWTNKLSHVDQMLSDLQKKPQKTAADREREKNLRDRQAEIKRKKQELPTQKTYAGVRESHSLTEGYADFKAGEGTPKQKIGRAIREINRQINEINRVVRMSARLKKESNLDTAAMWKSTTESLNVLEAKLNRLASTLRELKS